MPVTDAGFVPTDGLIVPISICSDPADDAFPSGACHGPPQTVDPAAATVEEVRPLLVGRWTRCAGVWAPTQDPTDHPVGLELTEEGEWFLLRGAGADRTEHPTERGTWSLESSTDLELRDQEGTLIVADDTLQMGCAPLQIMVAETLFARGPAFGEPVQVATPGDFPSEPCEDAEVRMPLQDPESMRAGVVGTWQVCGGAFEAYLLYGGFHVDTEIIGIEFHPNGRWYLLRLRDNVVFRGGHVEDTGTWFVSQEADGSWYLNLERIPPLIHFGPWPSARFLVSEDPRKIVWYVRQEMPMILVAAGQAP